MQAFSGIRVIDFTHVLAGPFCTYQLAVMGAEVIKIESPRQPDMMRAEGASEALAQQQRGAHYLAQGANKKSLQVDLGSEQGREIILQLIASADVLVENFRYGVMQRYGLGYDDACAANPALIYCSMTGFGHTGPKARHPAYDNVIQAFSGLMSHTGDAQSAPVRVGPPVLDYGTGSQAAFAIAAALFQRQQTDQGQHIDVAMLDAALMMMSTSVIDTQIKGQPPQPPGNNSLTHPGYGCFDTPEGLIMIGAFTARQHADLWAAIGRDDMAEQVKSLDSHALAARLPSDRALLAEVLNTKPAQEWEDLLNNAGVPAARVRTLDEALAHPQVSSRQVLSEAQAYSDEEADLQAPVAAFAYRHNGPSLQHHAPPRGSHTDEVLQQIGYSE
ncbi:MAG: CoA transferase, partial [Pseudomonadota bacterium]